MIKSLRINNFRSVEDQTIDLTPINFFYGNNAAGKSTVFYALNVLRNVVSNANQSVANFFHLGFINLGGFNQVVFKHEENRDILISVTGEIDAVGFTYGVRLNSKQGVFSLDIGSPYSLKLLLPVVFPYPSNATAQQDIKIDENVYAVNWNGITAQVTPKNVNDETNQKAKAITSLVNGIVEFIREVDLVPLKRGFSEPQYGLVNITQFPITEQEVASKLIHDEFLDAKVSTYLEQIIDRQFRVKSVMGTQLHRLTTIEKSSKQTSDVVNDGFGVNQLVYLLAKTLNKSTDVVCIEEPEINLHPGIIRRFPQAVIEIAKDEGKQMLISTHSEALMIAVLASIAGGEASKDDFSFYLTERSNNGVTKFTKQEITDDGQVQGGLISFMQGQLEDVQRFLKKKPKKKQKPTDDTSVSLNN